MCGLLLYEALVRESRVMLILMMVFIGGLVIKQVPHNSTLGRTAANRVVIIQNPSSFDAGDPRLGGWRPGSAALGRLA